MKLKNLFNPENRFWSFIDKLVDVCVLAVCWIVASLPVVTCGAATVAALSFMLRQVDDTESYAVRTFRKVFVSRFKKATFLWLCFASGMLLFGADFYALLFFRFPKGVHVVAFALTLCCFFVFAISFLYAFALLACFDTGGLRAVKDGMVMAFQHPVATVEMLLVFAVAAGLSYLRPLLSPFFFAYALFACAYVFRHVFAAYSDM